MVLGASLLERKERLTTGSLPDSVAAKLDDTTRYSWSESNSWWIGVLPNIRRQIPNVMGGSIAGSWGSILSLSVGIIIFLISSDLQRHCPSGYQ